MENNFEAGDTLNKLLASLKKFKNLTAPTRHKKIKAVYDLLREIKQITVTAEGTADYIVIRKRYKKLKTIAIECLTLLKGDLNLTVTENDPRDIGDEDDDKEILVDNVDVLRADDPEVPEVSFVTFLKSRLVGAARGSLEGVQTLAVAKATLKEKFAVQLTPIAVEAELRSLKQRSGRTVTEFGSEIEKLATKLAAAWVSKGPPFTTEASARPVVEPIAVHTFMNGYCNNNHGYDNHNPGYFNNNQGYNYNNRSNRRNFNNNHNNPNNNYPNNNYQNNNNNNNNGNNAPRNNNNLNNNNNPQRRNANVAEEP
ncbi:dr1-associated corepressor homolog [Wyeomyia smithii]|uniref:dr1-associated corepressor homolog n=1 Tax=Wyeomyia smithii TaxID=174621 RepID=UPI002467F3A8|nr:dr1-associated corepressor homolog [Wyeomyia smithii]